MLIILIAIICTLAFTGQAKASTQEPSPSLGCNWHGEKFGLGATLYRANGLVLICDSGTWRISTTSDEDK